MNSCCPGHLRQPGDRLLNLLGGNHHEICQFIDQDDDIRQVFINALDASSESVLFSLAIFQLYVSIFLTPRSDRSM